MSSANFLKHSLLKSKLEKFLYPYFQFKTDINVNPLQSWVFIAHYKFAVGILSCLFTCVVSCWFALTPMECNSKYDRSDILDYQEDICLSYPYTYNAPRDSYFVKREKIYALHYRWVHWAILVLVPIYALPLWFRKEFDHNMLTSALKNIANNKNKKQFITCVVDEIIGFSTSDLYIKKLFLHFLTLLLDLVAFAFLDISLQNRFALLPFDYPFTRWPQYFNDTLSLAFPPFVECNLGADVFIMLNMEEKIGCRLPLMILYDKLFIFLWLFMVLLTFWSLFTLIYWIFVGVCNSKKRNLIARELCGKYAGDCARVLYTGDLMCLNTLSYLVNDLEYKEILRRVANFITKCEKENNFSLSYETAV